MTCSRELCCLPPSFQMNSPELGGWVERTTVYKCLIADAASHPLLDIGQGRGRNASAIAHENDHDALHAGGRLIYGVQPIREDALGVGKLRVVAGNVR